MKLVDIDKESSTTKVALWEMSNSMALVCELFVETLELPEILSVPIFIIRFSIFHYNLYKIVY